MLCRAEATGELDRDGNDERILSGTKLVTLAANTEK